MKEIDLLAALRALPLFSKTDERQLADWMARHQLPLQSIPKGKRINRLRKRDLGVVLQGCAEIQSADRGRHVILRELQAPGIFGAAAMFCEKDFPVSRIMARSDSLVLYIPAEAVDDLMRTDDGFRAAYLAFLSDRIRFLNRKILCYTAGNTDRRLALWLISEENRRIILPASVTAFANMLDMSRASVYRGLDKLESEDLIRRNGREIIVISPKELVEKYQ